MVPTQAACTFTSDEQPFQGEYEAGPRGYVCTPNIELANMPGCVVEYGSQGTSMLQHIKVKQSKGLLRKREDRCHVCHSCEDVEDEQHFLFDCPAYNDNRTQYASLLQQAFSVSDFFTNSEHVVVFSESAFHVGSLLYPSDTFLRLERVVWWY